MKRDIQKLQGNSFDVIVVGGGIYGSAVAWDAALRGLSVALIERDDFGSGTTFNSLKIVHGGLRYLQTLDLVRFNESVRERTTMMGIAPHLVHPIPCVMPTYGHAMKGREVLLAGLLLNDILSMGRNRLHDPEKMIPRGRIVSKRQCLHLIPGIDSQKVTGGAMWTDGQMVSSERLVLAFVMSAVERGAVAANYVEAEGLLQENNHVVGVKAKDHLTGRILEVRGKTVINTTGGWVEGLLAALPGAGKRCRLSTAMNLVIHKKLLPETAVGFMADFSNPLPGGGTFNGRHVLFMAPWREFTLAGTYHRPFPESVPPRLEVAEEEVVSFLREINSAWVKDPIRREDVSFAYKGFLPMDGVNPKTGEVILTKHYRLHDHAREDGIEGMISVQGVKYTTARDVAEKVVDMVFKKWGRRPPACGTAHTALAGGNIGRFREFQERTRESLPELVSDRVLEHLISHYGSDIQRLLRLGKTDGGLLKPLPGSDEVTGAEVLYGVREEMAVKLSDIVLRRTPLGVGMRPSDDGLKVCADLMGSELGWEAGQKQEEMRAVRDFYRLY